MTLDTRRQTRTPAALALGLGLLLSACGGSEPAPEPAEDDQGPQLRQGYFHTEEEARAELARQAGTYATLDEVERARRADPRGHPGRRWGEPAAGKDTAPPHQP